MRERPNGLVEDDTQAFLVKMAKKICQQMTVSSLMKARKYIEKTLDILCPEWRKLDRD